MQHGMVRIRIDPEASAAKRGDLSLSASSTASISRGLAFARAAMPWRPSSAPSRSPGALRGHQPREARTPSSVKQPEADGQRGGRERRPRNAVITRPTRSREPPPGCIRAPRTATDPHDHGPVCQAERGALSRRAVIWARLARRGQFGQASARLGGGVAPGSRVVFREIHTTQDQRASDHGMATS